MEIEERGGCLSVEVELGIFLSLRDLLYAKGGEDLFHALSTERPKPELKNRKVEHARVPLVCNSPWPVKSAHDHNNIGACITTISFFFFGEQSQ
jgi:hypothetical protein